MLLGACGSASVPGKGMTAQGFFRLARSWSTNHPLSLARTTPVTFVHEIGHGLGANHDPANFRGILDEPEVRPYALGHTDVDVMPSLGTAMSYRGQVEPFFLDSAAPALGRGSRHRRTSGTMSGLLQETVHIAVRFSDYLPSLDPAPPSDVRVRFEGGAAHLTWRDNAPDADGYEVEYWNTDIRQA